MEGKLNLVCCLSVFCLAILTYRISDYESESQPKRYGDSCAKYLADNISGIIEEDGTQPKIQNTKYVPSGEFLWSRGRALSPLGSRTAVDLRWCCDSGLVGLRGLFGLFCVCHRAIKINSSSWKVTGGPSNPRLRFTRATISLSISRWVRRYQRNLSKARSLF